MPAKPRKLTYNPLEMIVSGDETTPGGPVTDLDPAQIAPNPHQPRSYQDPAAQAELEASVRESGVHEPLIVRTLPDGSYQLVAGGRRLAAAQAVGLATVPVVVREYTDAEAEQVALIENLQRANLRFDDEAQALLRLKQRFRLTNEAIGRSIGKSTDYVELRIAAAEHPPVLALYMAGRIDQKQIRAAVRALERGESLAIFDPTPADPNGSDQENDARGDDPNGSDQDLPASLETDLGHPERTGAAGPRGARPGRRPPDGWRWASDAERRLQQLPERATRMDAQERAHARLQLLRLREATDHVLGLLNE
jgi:ParB/RepB/Spo0J family partition protein